MSGGGEPADRIDLPVPPATLDPSRLVRSRYRGRDFALRRALLIADLLGLCLAFAVALLIAQDRSDVAQNTLWILPTLPFWAVLFWAYRLYGRPTRRFEPTHLHDTPAIFHALILGTLGLWLFLRFVAPIQQFNLEEVVLFGLLALPLITSLRVLLRMLNLRLQGPERVFVVAPIEDVRMLHRKLRNHPEYEMALVGTLTDGEPLGEPQLQISASLDDLEPLISSGQIDYLVVRLDDRYIPQERVHELMRLCHREGVRFGCFPTVKSLFHPGVEIQHVEGVGILTSNPPVLPASAVLVKRGLDIAVSAMLLTLAAPLLALIAIVIKLDSAGPVLYRQVRVGRDGKRFRLNKFRTMVPDADARVEELMKDSSDPDWLILEQDPRVTRVGRVLRRFSLDELPQLWNVLKGEMSLVGPRPLPERDDLAVTGWARHRLDLMPGVTGYWQVHGRNNIPFCEMVELDYAYVASWSMWRDIELLLRTIPVVLRRRGAN